MGKENRTVISIIIFLLVIISIAFIVLMLNQSKPITDFESCVVAGNPIMESFPRQCRTSDGTVFIESINTPDSIDTYFREALWQRGVDNLGGAIPIEGFNPDLYLGAFPGLVKEDFDGVEAINGRWYLRNNTLEFGMTSVNTITSADGTLTEQGVSELLDNLEERFNAGFTTKEAVDELLNTISKK